MNKIKLVCTPVFKFGQLSIAMSMVFLVACIEDPTRPILKTKPLSEFDFRTMASGGDILDDGASEIFQKGVIITHDKNPTMNPMDGGWSVDGYGNESWESMIIGSVEHIGTVYARAYAINGAGIGYGDVVSYTF